MAQLPILPAAALDASLARLLAGLGGVTTAAGRATCWGPSRPTTDRVGLRRDAAARRLRRRRSTPPACTGPAHRRRRDDARRGVVHRLRRAARRDGLRDRPAGPARGAGHGADGDRDRPPGGRPAAARPAGPPDRRRTVRPGRPDARPVGRADPLGRLARRRGAGARPARHGRRRQRRRDRAPGGRPGLAAGGPVRRRAGPGDLVAADGRGPARRTRCACSSSTSVRATPTPTPPLARPSRRAWIRRPWPPRPRPSTPSPPRTCCRRGRGPPAATCRGRSARAPRRRPSRRPAGSVGSDGIYARGGVRLQSSIAVRPGDERPAGPADGCRDAPARLRHRSRRAGHVAVRSGHPERAGVPQHLRHVPGRPAGRAGPRRRPGAAAGVAGDERRVTRATRTSAAGRTP